MSTFWRRCLWIWLWLAALSSSVRAQDARSAWSAEVLALAGELPVQDGGRIKPLSTFADFTLLRLNGKRTLTKADGTRTSAMEWLLDVLFFPEQAADDACFLVQDSQALSAIGLAHDEKRKRDRYTYDELAPGLPRLFALAHDYDKVASKERSALQNQVLSLAESVLTFVRLARHFDYARAPVAVDQRIADIFGGAREVGFHVLVERGVELNQIGRALEASTDPERKERWQALSALQTKASNLARDTDFLALIPPTASRLERADWRTPLDLLHAAWADEVAPSEHVALLAHFETLNRLRNDPAAFAGELHALRDASVALASARGECDKIPLERLYYELGFLGWSQVAFVLAFLSVSLLWLRPKTRWLARTATVAVVGGALLLALAIVLRCVIRGRPPVSTLYETVLFVTATGTLVALFLEHVHRNRTALSAAAVLGMVGLFLANGYETLDKQDTMPSLVAVLDTNFWLATHVTAITIGYSAGMLAALLASFYLIAKLTPWKRSEPSFYRALARMVYGVVCFAVIFSTIGTILGGIWANESWGRFWGWDPKENGALLIVISQLVLLHARMGGYLRERGVCIAAAFGGTVIAFSWWGVNLLGVGLHSYGFTSGIHRALWTYYAFQWSVCGLGVLGWWLAKRASARDAGKFLPSAPTSRAAA